VDGGSAQCVPGGTRLAQLGAQLENAIAGSRRVDRTTAVVAHVVATEWLVATNQQGDSSR
jgi:hypothetical protein